jgi:hypothetical protein
MKHRCVAWLSIAVAALGFTLIAAVPVAPPASAEQAQCEPQDDGDGQVCVDDDAIVTIHEFCDPKPCPSREPEQP